jgi:ribosomal protection tetracycline resistance protein
MVKVTPDDPSRQNELRSALETLSSEDPLLGVETLGSELHIRVMGAVQLEVIAELLGTRFGLNASLGAPNVIYRETIARAAVGFYAYTMPKPCWAVIKFEISPLPRGSGVRFESIVPAREILPRYQHQVEQAIPLAIKQGMLGWQVDDVLITLIGGEHHLIHTHPLDFILATPIAFMDGLRRGGSVLLEPILDMRITAPEGCTGRLLGEIIRMRGETSASQLRGNTMHIAAKAPLASSVDFSVRLAAITGGQGILSIRLAGYEACDLKLGTTCPRQSVHPLDTAKYILAARSALDGGVWDEI